jgi:hypothetical protein
MVHSDSMQEALLSGMDAAQTLEANQQSVEQRRQGKPRLRLADRSQIAMHLCSIDELVAVDHKVRVIWDAVCQMDLSSFLEPIGAREFVEGRPANDPRVAKNAKEQDRYAPREDDSEAVAQWRARMKTDEAKEIYKQRAATSETINADTRTNRGMAPFSVRGIGKVTCIALWSALAYTVLTFSTALT